ncbi:unnamed protein product [marine sediment metagenome]|uniref:Uncharacterized protein n=1 Tax=marine sediment metagenome TaxID=412755 RepID=X1LWG6_9ZZZZ
MQPSIRRGVAFAEDVRFCFTVFEDNEQKEPGDTLEHTWWKKNWPVCTTKWLYVWGSRAGETCVSTTAPFKYHNDGVDPIPPPPPVLQFECFNITGSWCPGDYIKFHNFLRFQPATSYTLTTFEVYLGRGADTSPFDIGIHEAYSGGFCNLTPIWKETQSTAGLPYWRAGAWREVVTPGIPLTAGAHYAIGIHSLQANKNQCRWHGLPTNPCPGCWWQFYRYYDALWLNYPNNDLYVKIYGE